MVKRKAGVVDANQKLITSCFHPVNRKRSGQDAAPSQPSASDNGASSKAESAGPVPSIAKPAPPSPCPITQPQPSISQPPARSIMALSCGRSITVAGVYAPGDVMDDADTSRCTNLLREMVGQRDILFLPSAHGPDPRGDHRHGGDPCIDGPAVRDAATGAAGGPPPPVYDVGAATEAFLARLTAEQRRAVTSELDAPLQILAAAGTGKTTTMTARILYAIQKGVPPQHILAVTFTNKAAGELRARVRDCAGAAGERVSVQTFHALAYATLMAYYRVLGYTKRPTVYATDGERLEVAKKALADWYTANRCRQLKDALESLVASATATFDNDTISSERRRELASVLNGARPADWQASLNVVSELWPRLYRDCVTDAEEELTKTLGKAVERAQKAEERRQKKKERAEEQRMARNAGGAGKGNGQGIAGKSAGSAGGNAAGKGNGAMGKGASASATAPLDGSAAVNGDDEGGGGQHEEGAEGQEGDSGRSRTAAYLRHQILLGFVHEEVMRMWDENKDPVKRAQRRGGPRRSARQQQQQRRQKHKHQGTEDGAGIDAQEGAEEMQEAGTSAGGGKPARRGRKTKADFRADPDFMFSRAAERACLGDGAKELLGFIGAASATGKRPSDFLAGVDFKEGFGYTRYLHHLKAMNAVDFDELMYSLLLLLKHPVVLRQLQGRFQYMLVDEFQDTNTVQAQVIEELQRHTARITVSIYGFRGADIANFRRFQAVFSGCTALPLVQNFRSTKNILDVGNRIIQVNKGRLKQGKPVEALLANGTGSPVTILSMSGAEEEAEEIARQIGEVMREDASIKYRDIAILLRNFKYGRLGTVHRTLQRVLLRHHIPYLVVKGVSLLQQTEVLDVLAYLKLAMNFDDDSSFMRIVNKPARGIGAATLALLRAKQGMLWEGSEPPTSSTSLMAAAKALLQEGGSLPARAVSSLRAFTTLMDALAEDSYVLSAPDMLASVLERSGYRAHLAKGKGKKGKGKRNEAAGEEGVNQEDGGNQGDLGDEEEEGEGSEEEGSEGTEDEDDDDDDDDDDEDDEVDGGGHPGSMEHACRPTQPRTDHTGASLFQSAGSLLPQPGVGAAAITSSFQWASAFQAEPGTASHQGPAAGARGPSASARGRNGFVPPRPVAKASATSAHASSVTDGEDSGGGVPPADGGSGPGRQAGQQQNEASQQGGKGRGAVPHATEDNPLGQLQKVIERFHRDWVPPFALEGFVGAQESGGQQELAGDSSSCSEDGGMEERAAAPAGSSTAARRRVPTLFRLASLVAMDQLPLQELRESLPEYVLEQILATHKKGRLVLQGLLTELALQPAQDTASKRGRANGHEGAKEEEPDAVSISTIHQAKGLEWPVVFLAHWNDKFLPSELRLNPRIRREDMEPAMLEQLNRSHNEEERRLAYVAVTRAKKHLFASHLRVFNAQRGLHGACLAAKSCHMACLPPQSCALVRYVEGPKTPIEEELLLKHRRILEGYQFYQGDQFYD
eukprot:jgi/Mesvir1/11621/Mv00027-RA.3